MAVGSWDLNLRPDTPYDVLGLLDLGNRDGTAGFAHIVITDPRVDAAVELTQAADPTTTPHPLLGLARYTGIVRDVSDRRTHLSGPGLAAWLGDEDDKGRNYETIGPIRLTWAQWMDFILDGGTVTDVNGVVRTYPAGPVYKGTIHPVTDPLASLLIDGKPGTRRGYVQTVCDHFQCEWIMRPTGRLDAGYTGLLYGQYPRTLIARRVGVEVGIDTVAADRYELDATIEDYATRTVVHDDTGAVLASAGIGGDIFYKNLLGEQVRMTRFVGPDDNTVSHLATALLDVASTGAVATRLDISGEHYTVKGPLHAGETVYLWDPEMGMSGGDTNVDLGYQVIRPLVAKVQAVEWPVKAEMGVYLLRWDGTAHRVTDLADWVEPEDGSITLEIGARRRGLLR